ncbi:MAG: G5 and 3D domain-containing protein [Desulfitobacteriaceae bacterium]
MYSLPITTYTDYWRTTRLWSTYLGGTVALLAGTSLIGPLAKWQTLSIPIPRVTFSTQTSTLNRQQPAVPIELPKVQIPAPAEGAAAPPTISTQITTEYRLEDVEIPLPIEYRESSELPPGMRVNQEEGKKGLKRQVVKVVQTGGNTEEEIVHEFQLNAPKKRVVIQNTKPITGEPFDLSSLHIAKAYTVEATAYTYTGNPTASGVYPRQGLIAVDPKVIPLGSRVYVEGYGYAIAADTGGAILGNKVDVFFPSVKECMNWGRRPVRLFMLASGS